MQLKENVELKTYTTFKAGGPARYFVEPETIDDIKEAIEFAKQNDLNITVLGMGSNVLVSDKGIKGLVMRFGKNFSDIKVIDETDKDKTILAKAGCSLALFGNKCTDEGLAGAEFCCGIPGSVGGAVYMNAGAYGGEIKDLAVEVTYLDIDSMEINVIPAEECDFGYRRSIFTKNNWIVLELKATISKGNQEEVRQRVLELKAKRIASQPVDVPSAGSTFKRPEGYFAGTLIQEAGLKGFSLDESGAQVSPKHAGFVVNNEGKASASDIKKLINYVSDKVFELNNVRLEPEVKMLGDWE